jgi:hypothetical protein
VALMAGLLGVVLIFVGLTSHHSSPAPGAVVEEGESTPGVVHPTAPAAGQRHSSREGHTGGVEDLIKGPVLRAAEPLSVAIPRLHIASRLETLGVDSQGAMEVPDDPASAGWYSLGPPPGALGPAVIAGHVTWNQVPAVFFHLAELRSGDVIEVARSDDRIAVFEVTRVRRYEKSEFPTQTVFGAIDHAGLRLITCGGEYDSAAHRYSDNVVAFAKLVRHT